MAELVYSFTFHYVYIYITTDYFNITEGEAFTFHYVYIYIAVWLVAAGIPYHLHSTMFIFI